MEKLKKELDYLVSVERPAISKQIGEARDKGDLSENAEYDAAREAQGMCELKISKLKDLIANAKIIDESKVGTDKVQLLNKVKLQNLGNNSIMEFTIVAESEANIAQGKLASSTPIAKAILGKKKGDVVEARVPNGIIKLKVLEISI
ncbi:MAG: transcription elongation factor GreA [Bacteroidales bacterium]|nr:transcription elongation factor GreA [Bacteroidales bacterium]